MHVCVGPNGKLTRRPTIAKTSGSARLDDGAIKLAKAGSGRYSPGTRGRQADPGLFNFRIRFQMTK